MRQKKPFLPESAVSDILSDEISDVPSAFDKRRTQMMADPELSDDQKEVLRCICYWFSLEAMNSVPLSDEDEEDLF